MNLRKILPLLLLIVTISVTAKAQFQPHSLGLRFGGGYGNGAEISYQSMLSPAEDTRLEANLGLSSSSYWSAYSLNVGHQWLFPVGNVDGLIWYAGANAQIGSWGYKDDTIDGLLEASNEDSSGFYIGVGGTVGIEYTLPKAPIQFSIDTRPMINFINPVYSDSFNFGGALAVRYIF